MGGNPIKGKTR